MHSARLAILSIVFVGLWSSGWILSRFAIDEISAITLLTYRYLIVFAVLWVLVLVTDSWKRIKRINIRGHLLVGVLSHAIYLLAGVGSFELGVSAALVAFITALQPMLTALMSRFITSEPIALRHWQGLIIGLCAIMLLISQSYTQGVAGYALILPFIAVVSLSIGILISRRIDLDNRKHRRKSDRILPVLFLHCVGALTVLLPLSFLHEPITFRLNTEQWVVVLWLALVVSTGAYGILLLLLRHINAMQVSSLSYLVPPATMIQAWFVFGETISALGVAALLLAAAGVFLVMRPSVKQAVKPLMKPIGPGRYNQQLIDIEL